MFKQFGMTYIGSLIASANAKITFDVVQHKIGLVEFEQTPLTNANTSPSEFGFTKPLQDY